MATQSQARPPDTRLLAAAERFEGGWGWLEVVRKGRVSRGGWFAVWSAVPNPCLYPPPAGSIMMAIHCRSRGCPCPAPLPPPGRGMPAVVRMPGLS